jgi:hypothetical protein
MPELMTIIKLDCPLHGHIEIKTPAPPEILGSVRCPFPHCDSEISHVDIWLGGIKVASWNLKPVEVA